MSQLEIERLLMDCRSGDPSRQTPAIMRLRDLEIFEATSTLIELLTFPDDNVRGCAVEALGWVGSRDIATAGSALTLALADPEPLIRSDALEALARLEYTSAIKAVTTLLRSDPDWVVRATAAEALVDLAEIGDLEVLAALEFALDDAVDSVRAYAVCSISLLGEPSPELLARLQVCLASEESLSTKAEILAARYRLGIEADLDKLLELLGNADEYLAGIILNILGDLATRRTPETLISNLPKLKNIITQVANSFPVHKNHAERTMADLEEIVIQSQLLGFENST